MPGLVVFGRRWSIGSDDLILPASGLAFLNSVWIVSLTSIVVHTFIHRDKHELCAQNFIWYPTTTIAVFVVMLALHIALAVVSGSGGVFEKKARQNLPTLCYIRTTLFVFEVVWSSVGCVLIHWKRSRGECTASDQLYILMCVVVGTNMVALFLTLLTMYFCFDSAGRTFAKLQYLHKVKQKTAAVGSPSDSGGGQPGEGDTENAEMIASKLQIKYQEKWRQRVKSTFCCERKSNDKQAFQQIGLLLAGYLDHLDLVLSDFIAGMMLLRKHQRAVFTDTIKQPTNDVYQYLSGAAISPRTKFLTLKDDNLQCEFQCMVHFMEYATAAYGWAGQCYFYPGQACCKVNLCGRCRCCPSHNPDITLQGDNCCQCEYMSIKAGSPMVDEDDFIYGNYENECGMPSYYVCLDHKHKKVLLCVRGTMSFSDTLIDLQGDSEEIKVNPAQPTWHGHMGMITAAQNILDELEQTKALETAFSRCPTMGYNLLIIGHSLGAGVAALIAFLLREQYPQLYCYSYSPPGGLLSPEAMEESKKFITSVVLGKDVIPRLGLAQLEYLRSDLLSLLETSSTPKWRILASTLPLLRRCLRLGAEGALPRSRSQNYNPFQSRALSSSHKAMFMPGKVVHIVKNYPQGKKSKELLYQAIWADNGMFDEIIVSPSMFDDHMPNNVLKAMQEVMANHGPKKPCKMLTEEERQAILLTDEENPPDRHSNGSGLSWEYTCQLEADVAVKTPTAAAEQTVTDTSKTKPAHLLPVSCNGGIDTPTQWLPAPLASQEDLLSMRQSTPSLSSQRGFYGVECCLHSLSESPDSNTLPKRSKSLGSGQNSLMRVRRKHSRNKKTAAELLLTNDSSAQPRTTESNIRQSHSINSPIVSTLVTDTCSPNELSVSAPDHVAPDHITPYIAHLGSGNQVEYTSTNGHSPQSSSGGCLHIVFPDTALLPT